MGNVSPSLKEETTVANPLISSEKRLLQQQNDLNSRQRAYKTLPAYIQSSTSNFSPSSSDKTYSDDSGLPVSDVCSPGQRSPSPLSNGNIRLTMDVNNSRPTSRSSTPVLNRKPAMNHHNSGHSASTAITSDANKSSSSSSLKDSQAKDIMISYSHLDKEIMIKLKGNNR